MIALQMKTCATYLAIFALTASALADDKEQFAKLSDDGKPVTVLKVPNALKRADFSNQLGLVAVGTRARLLGVKKKDPVVPAIWVQVEMLEGKYKGQRGWVMEQVVEVLKKRPTDLNRAARDVGPDNKAKVPAQATHVVLKDNALFSKANILSPTAARVSPNDYVQETDQKPDVTTSFYWIKATVLSGKQKAATGWLPSHALKPLYACAADTTKYPKTRTWAEKNFPKLKRTNYTVVRPRTKTNCFGYVLGLHNKPINPVYSIGGLVTDEVKTLARPYGYMDDAIKRKGGYQARKPITGMKLDSVPARSILVYVATERLIDRFFIPHSVEIPVHVAIRGNQGCWKAVSGHTEPLFHLEDPHAMAGKVLGTPKWIYLPSKKP